MVTKFFLIFFLCLQKNTPVSKTETIQSFYTAFQQGDAEKMVAFYHPEVIFSDPVFDRLSGGQAMDMWRMLLEKGKGNLRVTFSDIHEVEGTVTARWEAVYPFSQTGRVVTNKVKASFSFQEEKIILHVDDFSFHKWASMALGLPGTLFGWTSFLKNTVRSKSLRMLERYSRKKTTYEQKT